MTKKMQYKQELNNRYINYLVNKYSFFELSDLFFNMHEIKKDSTKCISYKSFIKDALRKKDIIKYRLILYKLYS